MKEYAHLAEARYYPEFQPGDEVSTTKSTWKAITANKPYTVIECQLVYPNHNVLVITLLGDAGFVSKYATYHFQKTERQIRQDKINQLLETNDQV